MRPKDPTTAIPSEHAGGPRPGPATKLEVGAVVPARGLTTILGDVVNVPDDERIVHLQLRRFAGCPVCSLHLRSYVRRHEEVRSAGIAEVVVFHSTVEELLDHASKLPFAVVGDPGRRLYTEFGAERSIRAVLDPRAWGTIVRAVVRSLFRMARGLDKKPADGSGRTGLPAEFLIAPGGRVLDSKYGAHVNDHWSVDELLVRAEYASP